MARATTADLLAQVCAEIDGRLAELRPAVEEYERLLGAADALEADAAGAATAERSVAPRAAARRRAKPAPATAVRESPVAQAIVAALEHGSHTLGELVVVTAMTGAEIRESVRGLQRLGKVVRAKRAGDGRAAYALSGAA